MRLHFIFYIMLTICYAAPALAVSPSVTSVQATQMQDASRKVKITYYLTDPDSASVYITVSISTDNGATYTIAPSVATGDIGWVKPGGTRIIYWDAKSQYPQGKWASCKAKITVDDSTSGVCPGEMMYIPAGSFLMGNNITYYPDEQPQHFVHLSGYWIGKYEVTRGEYRQFMNASGYSNSTYWSSAGWSWKVSDSRTQPYYWDAIQNWGTGEFTQTDNHPVVGVSYYEAEAFCNWAGGHLPTEAQWEKAARWTGSYPNIYPWDNTWDTEKCNNYEDTNPAGGGYGHRQTAPVGSYPTGVSSYGCHDMAGNVFEWCKDWYQSHYYSQTPVGGWSNPQGPSNGSSRVLRGGGWNVNYMNIDSLRCANRVSYSPYGSGEMTGFRIAR